MRNHAEEVGFNSLSLRRHSFSFFAAPIYDEHVDRTILVRPQGGDPVLARTSVVDIHRFSRERAPTAQVSSQYVRASRVWSNPSKIVFAADFYYIAGIPDGGRPKKTSVDESESAIGNQLLRRGPHGNAVLPAMRKAGRGKDHQRRARSPASRRFRSAHSTPAQSRAPRALRQPLARAPTAASNRHTDRADRLRAHPRLERSRAKRDSPTTASARRLPRPRSAAYVGAPIAPDASPKTVLRAVQSRSPSLRLPCGEPMPPGSRV